MKWHADCFNILDGKAVVFMKIEKYYHIWMFVGSFLFIVVAGCGGGQVGALEEEPTGGGTESGTEIGAKYITVTDMDGNPIDGLEITGSPELLVTVNEVVLADLAAGKSVSEEELSDTVNNAKFVCTDEFGTVETPVTAELYSSDETAMTYKVWPEEALLAKNDCKFVIDAKTYISNVLEDKEVSFGTRCRTGALVNAASLDCLEVSYNGIPTTVDYITENVLDTFEVQEVDGERVFAIGGLKTGVTAIDGIKRSLIVKLGAYEATANPDLEMELADPTVAGQENDGIDYGLANGTNPVTAEQWFVTGRQVIKVTDEEMNDTYPNYCWSGYMPSPTKLYTQYVTNLNSQEVAEPTVAGGRGAVQWLATFPKLTPATGTCAEYEEDNITCKTAYSSQQIDPLAYTPAITATESQVGYVANENGKTPVDQTKCEADSVTRRVGYLADTDANGQSIRKLQAIQSEMTGTVALKHAGFTDTKEKSAFFSYYEGAAAGGEQQQLKLSISAFGKAGVLDGDGDEADTTPRIKYLKFVNYGDAASGMD